MAVFYYTEMYILCKYSLIITIIIIIIMMMMMMMMMTMTMTMTMITLDFGTNKGCIE